MTDERAAHARQLRRLAVRVDRLADALDSGEASRDDFVSVVAELRGITQHEFGKKRGEGPGAKTRILNYLLEHVGEVVPGEELAEVAGSSAWARRVRELRRDGGYDIEELGQSRYRLNSPSPRRTVD